MLKQSSHKQPMSNTVKAVFEASLPILDPFILAIEGGVEMSMAAGELLYLTGYAIFNTELDQPSAVNASNSFLNGFNTALNSYNAPSGFIQGFGEMGAAVCSLSMNAASALYTSFANQSTPAKAAFQHFGDGFSTTVEGLDTLADNTFNLVLCAFQSDEPQNNSLTIDQLSSFQPTEEHAFSNSTEPSNMDPPCTDLALIG